MNSLCNFFNYNITHLMMADFGDNYKDIIDQVMIFFIILVI